MSQAWENEVHLRRPHQYTRFTSVRCDDTQDAMKYFGKFSPEGHTILVCMPQRGSCKPWITIPEGVIAVVTKNGEFLGYWESGLHWCLPWTEAQYLVTKQNIVFNMPVSTCPTSDNIFVEINVSVVLQIQPEHEYVHQLCMNINELNQMLDAAITERVRHMARSVSSRKVYSLRGEEHAVQMLSHLKEVMATKGILIKSVIITNVKLPFDVAAALQEKTIFQFKNTLERKKQSYELRTINDKTELQLLKQQKIEERKDVTEKAELEFAGIIKEIEKIKASKSRVAAEIKEKTKALVNEINANTNVKYNEILAEANLIETDILANARADAAKIKAEADGYALKKISESEKQNAQLISQALNLEGDAESKMLKGFKRKRKHLQIMERLSAMSMLTQNKDLVVFGEQGANLMAALESFKMVLSK